MARHRSDGELNWPSPNEEMSPEQIATVVVLERFGGTASMVGVMLIFITFFAFKRLRTVPNLFIMMASIANVGASIACMIGRDGVEQGESSALCQAQAFMLEMMMQSDPWWSLAMAANVLLVFFYGASTTMFRQYLWVYAVICYGVPLVPALALLFVRDSQRGAVYGDATLWCWIEPRWNALRIYTYYLPIWVCIFFSVIIYIAVGCHVFHQRNQLRNLTFSNQGKDSKDAWTSQNRDSGEKNRRFGPDCYGTAVTEVQIVSTSDSNQPWTPPVSPYSAPGPSAFSPSVIPPPRPALLQAINRPADHMSHPPFDSSEHITCADSPESPIESVQGDGDARPSSVSAASAFPRPPRIRPHNTHHSSFHTTCTSTQPLRARSLLSRLPIWVQIVTICSTFRHKYRRVDPVKKAYLRTSAIFALSVLFTWTPSSINRVYSLLHPETVSYPLNVASAFVLPLQGVWNAVIYFSTSWRPLCDEFRALRGGRFGCTPAERTDGGGASTRFHRGKGARHSEDSSEMELSGSRPARGERGQVRAIRGSF